MFKLKVKYDQNTCVEIEKKLYFLGILLYSKVVN